MIVEAVISVLSWAFTFLADSLPAISDAPWSPGQWAWEDYRDQFASMLGPYETVMPLSELFAFLDFLLTVWVPAALTFTISKWVYAHMPLIGKG